MVLPSRVSLQRLAVAFAVVFSTLGPRLAHSTVVVPKSIEQLSSDASVVVRARVRSSMSAWDDAHRRIHTFTQLEVLETWAGDTPKALVVRTLGGEVGTVGMRVSGTARFRSEEEVVLFLRPDPLELGRFLVVGMSQGVYRIDRSSAVAMAVPGSEGLVFAMRDGAGGLKVAHGSPSPRPLPLTALQLRVREARASVAPGLQGGARPTVPASTPSSPEASPGHERTNR